MLSSQQLVSLRGLRRAPGWPALLQVLKEREEAAHLEARSVASNLPAPEFQLRVLMSRVRAEVWGEAQRLLDNILGSENPLDN